MLRILLVALLFGAGALAQISNVEIVEISDGAMSLRFNDPASATDVRVSYGTSSPTNYLNSTADAADNVWAVGSLEPGTTYQIRPEYFNGSAWVTDYQCGSDAGLDLTPSVSSTGSAACVSNVIEVTTEAAKSLTPAAPSGYPTPATPDFATATITRTLTPTDCADLRVDLIDLFNDAPDGNIDVIELPAGADWACSDFANITTKTNTDWVWVTTDAAAVDCPLPGVAIDHGYDSCYATLRGPTIGYVIRLGISEIGFHNVRFARPKIDSGLWSDVAAIASVADNGTDLDVTTSTTHGITVGGDPNRILVALCDEPELNGVWQYSTASGTLIRLTEKDDGTTAAGKTCTNGYVIQDPEWDAAGPLVSFGTSASDYGFDQCIFEGTFPSRQSMLLQSRGTDWWITNSLFTEYGNWAMLVSGAHDRGPQATATQAPGMAIRVDNAQRAYIGNSKFRGFGLAGIYRDTFQTVTEDLLFENLWFQVPSSRLDVDGNNGIDGVDDVVLIARHGGIELKICQRCRFDGFLCSGFPAAAGSDNTIADCAHIRRGVASSVQDPLLGTAGSRDVEFRNFAIHDMPQGITIEGKWNTVNGSLGNVHGRWLADNILGNELNNKRETGHGITGATYGGKLVQMWGVINAATIRNFTTYKPRGESPTFELFNVEASRLNISQGIIAGVGDADALRAVVKRTISDIVNPSIGSDSADAFESAARAFGTSSSFEDVVITTGLHDPHNDDYSVSLAADKIDLTEIAADIAGTSYSFSDVLVVGTAAGTSVADDIATLGLGTDWEYAGDGVSNGAIASGDEGVDGVQLKEALGILRAYTGESQPVALARSGDTGIRFRFRMPDTSTDTSIRYRPVGGSWLRQSCVAGASQDRECTLTGLTAGQRYEWWLETPSMIVRGRATPGS